MPFISRKNNEDFFKALVLHAMEKHQQLISQQVPRENIKRFHHGKNWTTVSETEPSQNSFEPVGVDFELHLDVALNHELVRIPEFIEKFVNGFNQQLQQKLYQTITKGCDAVGNTVDARQYATPAESFIEAIRKVEFRVDKEGKVSLPEIHLAPGGIERISSSFDSNPHLKSQLDELIEAKGIEALEQESNRLKKFKGVSR